MYSSVSRGIALLTVIITGTGQAANAEEKAQVSFSVQPQQCVTMRQGRDCFATVKIQWQHTLSPAVCLYQMTKDQTHKQLKCWSNSNQGQAVIEFESSENIHYQLRTFEGDKLIADAEVVVSWLHKNNTRRRRWRLF